MDEYFLHFLWKFQKFDSNQLLLTTGEEVVVFHPGFHNHDSGPDFSQAKLKIDGLTWSGSVEIHYRSSDWLAHKHQLDKAYENVILHVVWKQDKEIKINGKPIPTLELASYVSENLATEYRRYINQPGVILCENELSNIPGIQISAMLDKAFAARLQQKGERVLDILKTNDGDWEQTAYYVLARNFGFKTNSENFEKLAKSLPYKVIKKHLDHPNQVEALILGMSGLLEESIDDKYHESLSVEFDFLKKKYNLTPILSRHHWKFSRLRPANFPTVRLAQFIAVLSNTKNIFASLIDLQKVSVATRLINHPLPEYWQQHYDFQKPSKRANTIGLSSVENIIINSVAPLLTAYAKYIDDASFIEKAESLLSELKPEANYITKAWNTGNIAAANACDSQALIYQYQSLCKQKRCLQCNIGLAILNK